MSENNRNFWPSCDVCGEPFKPLENFIKSDNKLYHNECFESQTDNINKPNHYQGRDGLEVFDVFEEFTPCPEYVEGAYWSNVVKYILRFHKKNGVEDLKKAQVYLGKLIERLEDK